MALNLRSVSQGCQSEGPTPRRGMCTRRAASPSGRPRWCPRSQTGERTKRPAAAPRSHCRAHHDGGGVGGWGLRAGWGRPGRWHAAIARNRSGGMAACRRGPANAAAPQEAGKYFRDASALELCRRRTFAAAAGGPPLPGKISPALPACGAWGGTRNLRSRLQRRTTSRTSPGFPTSCPVSGIGTTTRTAWRWPGRSTM